MRKGKGTILFLVSAVTIMPAYLIALAVSYAILRLFPPDDPVEYIGVGFTPRLLPGTLLGLCIWLLLVRFFARRYSL